MAELRVAQERAMTDEEIAFCERSIPDVFDEVASRDPDALALDGEERATYGELADGADRVACGVRERLGEGAEPVGLMFTSTRGLVEAVLGLLRAGKIAMPIDLSAPSSTMASMLEDSGARLVLGDVPSTPAAAVVAPEALDGTGAARVTCVASGDSPSLLIYTSGSTGKPKGVLTRQGANLHTSVLAAQRMELGPGARLAITYSVSFAAGHSMIFAGLLSGATVLHYDAAKRGLTELPRWISEKGVTAAGLLSSMTRPVAAAAGPRGLPSLRYLGLGAESLARSDALVARSMLEHTAGLGYGYGATEVGTICSIVLDDSSLADGPVVPVGLASPGQTVRLLDVEDGVGEIVVTSRYLAHGYWRREQETARAFSVDSKSGERSYRTGDFGRIDEQDRLIIAGRRDRMVKVAGKRVELDAVEHALVADERVREAAVIARQRSKGANALVGYATPQSDTVDPRAVKESLRNTLPPYMIPSRIVTLDALPRLPNGKIDRRALLELQTSAGSAADGTSELTDLERRLLEIWEEVLEEPVGIDEDFFELGGDSLLAMELLVDIEERLGHSLTPEVLLEAPTIRRLAERISFTRPLADRSQSSSDSPPVFLVHELGGSGLRYRLLARELGDEFRFCRLQAPWWDGRMHKIRTVEQLAAFHVAKIRCAQPTGPYLLVGYSLGGMLALEIAQQLRADGEEIGLLAVLDTPITFWRKPTVTGDPRTWPMPAPTTTAHRIRRWLWMRWAIARHNARRICSWAIERCRPRQIALAWVRLVWWLDIHLRGAVPERRRDRYVMERIVDACRPYAISPYDGRVVVFRCTRPLEQAPPQFRRLFRAGAPDLGWATIVRGGLEIHDVDSDHLRMLWEPYVYELASKLGPVIRSATDEVVGDRGYEEAPVHS